MADKKTVTLRHLRKIYGYDVALSKQRGISLGDETAELESLALYHLNQCIIAALEEFFGYVGNDKDMQSGAIAVIMGAAGSATGVLEGKFGKRVASQAARLGKKYFEMQYVKTIKGDKQ